MPKRGRGRSKRPDSVGSGSDSAESKRSRSVVSSSSEESDGTMSVNSTESRSSTSVQEENLAQFVTVNRRQRKAASTTKPSKTPATPAVPAGRTLAPAPVSAVKMPPITVKSLPVAVLRPELQARGITSEFRISDVGTSITVRSPAEQQEVLNYLQQRNAEYFSHDAKNMRPFKAVLRGLSETDLAEIVSELKESYQLDVLEAFEIKRRAGGIQTRLYLVHFKRGTCSLKKLEAVRSIQQVIVRWVPYRGGKKGPTQCHRCQAFGHAPKYNLAKRLQDIRNAPDTPAKTPTTTPATTSAEDLFSPEELFAIFSRMLPKIRLCRNKGEQLAVIAELLMLLH
ncbi:uncharacterized protein LOC126562359 [Anopheles maculipalpis]|uniref:uncharacterized protein LOC126562359 n=1 Tax=Anopheles maculipalpis TaxID=1496333 RepID=UPI00215942D2|nr:uncharacterized protein LOC126562359 [Anopheles maculipalpis]